MFGVLLLAVAVPFGLTTEYRVDPVGLDVRNPRLGWKLPLEFSRQTAYEIEADGWRSGRIDGDEQVGVEWKGTALKTGMRVGWRVRVWDGERMSGWSRPASFTAGVMDAADWKASWIGPRADTRLPVDLGSARWVECETTNVFRKSFVLTSVPTGVCELAFTTRDAFKVWLNQSVIADTYWEHFHDWRDLRLLDVSRFLRVGTNELMFAVKPLGGERPALVASLDCGERKVVSDGSWGTVVLGWPTRGRRESESPAFEKSFAVSGKVARATLFITGVGFYEASLNGKRIGDKVLDPSPTAYDRRVLYSTYLLDRDLVQGENRISVLLGHGLYDLRTLSVWNFDNAPWRDFPRMIAQLEVEYADGRRQTVVSDGSWTQVRSPVRYDDIREGEVIAPACVGRIGPAEKVPGPKGRLVAESQPAAKIVRTLRPSEIREIGDKTWLVAFPENLSGWMRMRLRGLRAGQEISFTYDERLAADGSPAHDHDWRKGGVWGVRNDGGKRMIDVFFVSSRSYSVLPSSEPAFQRDRYLAAGRPVETYEPRFTFNGFRYVTVRGLAEKPRAEDIEACVVSTDFAETGRFDCSDEVINRLMACASRSYRSNFTDGFPTDCPHREKNGWMGDASMAAEMAQYVFDNTAGYEKWLADILDAQRPSGEVPCIVPTSGWGFMWGNGPTFDSALPEIAWRLDLHQGDRAALRRAYPAIRRLCAFTAREKTKGGLVDWGLADHAHVDGKSGAPTREYVATCYALRSNEIAARIAEVLDEGDEAVAFRIRAAALREAVRAKFRKSPGVFDNGGQTAQALALEFGLCDRDEEKPAGEALVAAFARADDHLRVGIVGMKHVLPALSRIGRADLAFKALTQPTFPSPALWTKDGSTTLWEDWLGQDGSLNHIMFGSFVAWAYGHLAGIRPLEPGFRRVLLAPEPIVALDHAKASVETPYGTVVSGWSRNDGALTYEFSVPPGTRAEVRLPDGTRKEVGPGIWRF